MSNIIDTHIKKVNEHRLAVYEAGRKLGVDKEQLAIHDLSKFTKPELTGYAMHFHGGGAPAEFAKAWLHHIHHNPHHWQHWMFPDNYSPKQSGAHNGILEMPERYALEMIADWMGASYTYTGSWDMTDWLSRNLKNVQLHPKTIKLIAKILNDLGYKDITAIVWKRTG